MNKQMKQERVDRLRDELTGSVGLVVASYQGLTVKESQELRAEVRNTGGKVRVIKNTLARLSLSGTEFDVITDVLSGANLLAFGDDPVGPAKAIAKVAKEGDKVVIKAGVLNGKRLTTEEVVALSKLPGLDELRSKLLGMFNQVPQRFVAQLASAPRGLVTVLSARRDELQESA